MVNGAMANNKIVMQLAFSTALQDEFVGSIRKIGRPMYLKNKKYICEYSLKLAHLFELIEI